MAVRRLFLLFAFLLVPFLTSACTPKDETAATAAGLAADALQTGDLANARFQIGRALAARDDVSDYWLLSGRIALAQGSYAAAYEGFENAVTLDRGNVEALTRLCQIATASNQADRAERYADQLLALRPDDKTAMSLKAAAALDRADKAGAMRLLDRVFAIDPSDPTAQIIRSRLLLMGDDYAGAARAAEASLTAPGDETGRLQLLEQAYRKASDAVGWRRTIARLARVSPDSAPAQLDYARSLYDAGDWKNGLAVSRRVLALKPGDVATADSVLHLWMAQGTRIMPVEAIAAAGANGVPETRATFAAYANARGRPDLALRVLGDAGAAEPPGTAVNDAKVARAQAQMLLGRRDEATRSIAAVLAVDPDQPRALALRGALRASAGDRAGAVEDYRHALSAEPGDANTRLALAELQLAGGDSVLASQTLEDGVGAEAGVDPRLATRLARLLRTEGRAAEADAVLTNYARVNPFAPRPPS